MTRCPPCYCSRMLLSKQAFFHVDEAIMGRFLYCSDAFIIACRTQISTVRFSGYSQCHVVSDFPVIEVWFHPVSTYYREDRDMDLRTSSRS